MTETRNDEPHAPDDALAERQSAERRERQALADGEPRPDGSAGATRESGYTTEQEQGAAQPAPTTTEEDR